MRGFVLFLGTAKRNQPVKLSNPHPVTDTMDKMDTGDAGKDGYTVLTRADPNSAGYLPRVKGEEGPVYWGPDNSFEQ